MISRFSSHSLLIPALALALAAAPPLASATELPAAEMSLDALVRQIVAHHPELAFYEAEIEAARIGHRTAGRLADPELSLDAGRKRLRDSLGVLGGEGTIWSVSITQTFEWPGRLGLRKSIANGQIELAELGLAQFRAALTARARLLTFTLHASTARADATGEVAARYQALRELFLARDPAGITPLLETRVIEARELVLQQRATDAALAASAALVELNQLRGAPVDAPLRVTGAPFALQPPPKLDRLLAAAREHNFAYRIRRVELEQQGLAVSLARNQRYPSVAVTPFYSQAEAGERETVAGIGLSLPLPVSSRSQAAVDVAERRRRQAEAALRVAQWEMEREITAAYRTFTARVASTERWRRDAPDQFRAAAELADRHYRMGAVPLATYVELQNSYLEAVDASLDTRRQALEAAQQLELLTGWPTPWVTTASETSP